MSRLDPHVVTEREDEIPRRVDQAGRDITPWLLAPEMELVALGYRSAMAVIGEVLHGGPRVLGTRGDIERQSQLPEAGK